MLRPLAIAIALTAGIAVAPAMDRAGAPASARWVAAAGFAVLASRRRELAIAAVIAVGAAHGADPGVLPGGQPDDHRLDTIAGVVAAPVVHGSRGWGALLDGTATWVWSPEPLLAGEEIAATGYLATPPGPRGPGLPDPVFVERSRGAELEMSARTIRRLADEPGVIAQIWRWAAGTQDRWSAEIDEAGGDPAGRAAMRGIAVGDRRDVPVELDARWRASGIFHVLSVSGLHLAVVAGLLYALLRKLIAGSPLGGRVRPAVWAAPVAFAVAIAYTLLTGAQLATVRALIVVGFMLAGGLLDRPARLIDALGIAAIAILVWRPADLFDPGFQLSFVAALTLALRHTNSKRGALHWIGRQLSTSAWVALATAPITAFHFHQVAAGGVIGNLVLTPLVELVALPAALAGLAIGWDLPIWIASTLTGWVDTGAGVLGTVAPLGTVAVASPLVMAALVTVSLLLVAKRVPRRIGWLALCLVWSLGRSPAPDGALRVTFVDVGQGDGAIVELPDGEVWLIDAGGNVGARDLDAGSRPGRTISRVLAAYGHDHVDVAIISHPHPDHFLGLAALDVPIGELWFAPGDTGEDRAFVAFAEQLAARGTRLVHPPIGLARERGGALLTTWAPRYQPDARAPVTLHADPVRTVNDNSLVVTVRYRDRTLLFTGDIEAEGEELLVADGLPRVDIVKVAHHGSPTSSSAVLVAATHPALAVISCGRGNHFGFPSQAVLERWRAAGAEVARTDTDGTIIVVIDAEGAITVERSAPGT